MKKNCKYRIIFSVFILWIIIITIKPVIAQNCSGGSDDGQGCTNGGDLRNGCNWICNEVKPDIKYVMPPCCETLAQTGDPFACCFDARRRCTPDQCASISGAQQRCGQLWTGDWNCPQTMQPTATPTKTISPTNIPSPTSIPPTKIPEKLVPTTPPSKPTSIMLPLPYLTTTIEPAQPTPDLFPKNNQSNQGPFSSFSLPSLSLPKINLPCINAKLSIASTNLIVQKPLGLFKNIFSTIKQMDKNMENMINKGFLTIVKKATQLNLKQTDQK